MSIFTAKLPILLVRALSTLPGKIIQVAQLSQGETELQGGLVLAKSGRLELGDKTTFTDIIGPIFNLSDVFDQQSNRIRSKTQKKTITPFKVIQGHRGRYQSKASMRQWWIVTDKLTYLVPLRSYHSLLFKFWTLCIFEPPLEDLGATYDDHLRLIEKRVEDFLLVLIELFSLAVTAEALYERISVQNRRFRSNWARLSQNFR